MLQSDVRAGSERAGNQTLRAHGFQKQGDLKHVLTRDSGRLIHQVGVQHLTVAALEKGKRRVAGVGYVLEHTSIPFHGHSSTRKGAEQGRG